MKHELVITRVYDLLIQAVYQYRFLTCEQATTLLYKPGMLTTVRARLKTLADSGYLLAVQLPTVRGQSPLVYTLARKGMYYVASLGVVVRERFRPIEEREKSYAFLTHSLRTNDVLIAAARLPSLDPRISVHEMRHEQVLKHTPLFVPSETTSRGQLRSVIPDGWLDIRVTRENTKVLRFTIWLELDRGTIEAKQFKRKLQAIDAIMQSEVYEKVFHATSGQVAFATTAGERRVSQMRAWAREMFYDSIEVAEALFRFTSLPECIDPLALFCMPIWFTLAQSAEQVALLGQISFTSF